MALAAVTLFLASALLFMAQPMAARQVLPVLGGTPAVWTTCMLFFQIALLAGYLYAHRAPLWAGPRHPRLHLVVLALPLVPLWLPVPPFWAAFHDSAPIVGLLALLAATIGLPFFALATTAPLVQRWVASSGRPGAEDPYVLYAASNAGSLVGLLAYPLWVEPTFPLASQRSLWAAGYGVVAIATAVCALRSRGHVELAVARGPLPPRRRLWWVLLSFAPSSLLLGVTTHITTNLAPVPLLWAIPLAFYLITFVIAFGWRPAPAAPAPAVLAAAVAPGATVGRRGAPVRRAMLPQWLPPFLRWTESPHPVTAILPVLLLPLAVMFWWEKAQHGPLMIVLHLAVFFLVALACHGRLAAARPEPARLTEFYLWIAVGGALGGICNALVAPVVFPALVEYPAVLALACCLLPGPVKPVADLLWGAAITAFAVVLLLVQPAGHDDRLLVLGPAALLALAMSEHPLRLGLGAAGILAVGASFNDRGTEVIHRDRSVFGAHHVERLSSDITCLVHGNILHGAQRHSPEHRREPLTYFHREGPCGDVFAAMAGRIPGGRVGAIGLGVGSIAAYAAPGEHWTFFEIDAAVERTARSHFTFLADAPARVDVQLGDGRLLIEQARDGEFGLILLDAFNSDAVPVHLLTREALAIYVAKLAPGGVLAFHVSSRYVDLPPVLADLAADAGLVAKWRHQTELSAEAAAQIRNESKWVVMARRAEDLARLAWEELPPRPSRVVWTDDHSSLLGVLRFFR